MHVRINFPSTLLLDGSLGKIAGAAQAAADLARKRDNTSVGCGVVPYEAKPKVVLRLRDLIQ